MSVEYLHGLWDRGAQQLAKLGLDQEQIEGALAIMTSEIAAISPSVREAAGQPVARAADHPDDGPIADAGR